MSTNVSENDNKHYLNFTIMNPLNNLNIHTTQICRITIKKWKLKVPNFMGIIFSFRMTFFANPMESQHNPTKNALKISVSSIGMTLEQVQSKVSWFLPGMRPRTEQSHIENFSFHLEIQIFIFVYFNYHIDNTNLY